MKILYLASGRGTSGHREHALRRLGHEVSRVTPQDAVKGIPFTGVLQRHFGSIGLASLVRVYVLKKIAGRTFDLIWVNSGALVSRALVMDLKNFAPHVINYNTDDPFGDRDANLWFQYRRAVSAYDLLVVVREPNVQEAYSWKARKVLRVMMSADEVAHAPRALSAEDRMEWGTEVLFAGTGFPERGTFVSQLIRLGVDLSIFGNSWQSLHEWKTIRGRWKGPDIVDPNHYAAAIQASKVSLGLLSKGNRDLHTTRSMEIPSLGGLFCGERTSEHLALYEEDVEAVFWNSPEECAAKCKALLSDAAWRGSIARKGRERYLRNGWTNMGVAELILGAL